MVTIVPGTDHDRPIVLPAPETQIGLTRNGCGDC